MNFCPQWIFDIASANTALDFISRDLELDAYAKKYERGLGEHYEVVSYSLISEGAEELLRFLAEIGEDSAAECLHSFIYKRTKFESKGKPRKMKSLLSTALDPDREPNYSVDQTMRNFRSFVFGLRAKTEFFAPESWKLADEENIDWLGELVAEEVSLFSLL